MTASSDLHQPCCILTLLLALLASQDLTQAEPSFETRLQTRLNDMQCPGALIGIFHPDGTSQRYALGVADVDTQAPIELDMHMRIASVTKLFLGAVILQLVDQGHIALDDPISKYVDGVPQGNLITLRQLGNNTSGLFNTIENKDFQRAIMAEPQRDWSAAQILQHTFVRDSYAPPGKLWRYSNTNAVLLGLVVAKVTGHPWPDAVDRLVCQPLQLKHTGVPGPTGQLPAPHPSAYRNGYPDKVIGYGDTFYNVSHYSASWTDAAGEMYSTLDDLGRAVPALVTGQLLTPASRSELHRWIDTGYQGRQYGFCIGRLDHAQGHTGDVPGYNVSALYLADRKTTVIALTNLSNNNDKTMPAEELANLVIQYLHQSSP